MNGSRSVTPYVMGMAVTDMEGSLIARPIDVLLPGKGWGSTENGQPVDTICDTSGLLIVCGAALRAPRVSLPAKAAVAGVLGTEGRKAAWAISSSLEYTRAGGEGRLDIPTSLDGKEAMVEKLFAVTLACATNDVDPGLARNTLSAAALCFAGAGGLRGERAREMYQRQFVEIMHDLGATPQAQAPAQNPGQIVL
jgi:hypothetical protein